MNHHSSHPSLVSYIFGFSFSLLLTLAAFTFAYVHVHSDHEIFSHSWLIPAIVALALLQLLVQTFFFLHLTGRPDTALQSAAYIFTVFMVAFIVIGSLWIMRHLELNMMPSEIDAYMHSQN